MAPTPDQIARTLTKFFEDFGTSDCVVRSAARRMDISESVAVAAAKSYEEALDDPRAERAVVQERRIREGAETLARRASAAATRGLDSATHQDLEAVLGVAWGLFR